MRVIEKYMVCMRCFKQMNVKKIKFNDGGCYFCYQTISWFISEIFLKMMSICVI